MAKRTCSKCGLESDELDLFAKNKTGKHGRENRCKRCASAKASRRHSTKHRENRLLITALKDKPCADCGESYPTPVMEFDHVRGTKEFTIGQNGGHKTVARILAEAAKCDVVCANCHRLRTMKRRGLL